METLQALAQIIKDLPDTAIWIIAIYFFFKLAVVGCIYGVIRLAIEKWHAVAIVRKNPPPVEIKATIEAMTIDGHAPALIAQLHRLRSVPYNTVYLRDGAVDFLRAALDAEFEKRKLQEVNK